MNGFEGHVFLAPSGEPVSGGWREVEQRPDGARGLSPRPQFQHLTQQHQGHDGGGGLEVDVRTSSHPAQCLGKNAGCKCGDQAVAVGHANAECNQRKHVGTAVDDGRPTTPKE